MNRGWKRLMRLASSSSASQTESVIVYLDVDHPVDDAPDAMDLAVPAACFCQ